MAFSISGQVVGQTASTTDTDLSALVTLINGIPAVARSTAYTVGQVVRPPTANGFMYRCSVAGTTAASAPTYGTTEGGNTVDGTATFVAHEAMQAITTGTGSDLYRMVSMGSFRLFCAGTLTVNGAVPELLAFGANCPEVNLGIGPTGNFTLGRRTTLNNTTRSEQRIGGLYFARRHTQHWTGRAIDNEGVMNIFGDIQGQTCPIRTRGSSVTTVRDAYWACRNLTNVAQSLWFHESGTIDIDGLTIEGLASFTRVINGVVTNFSNVRTVQADSTNQNETSTTPFDLFGFNPSGNTCDLGFWFGAAQIRGIRSYDSPMGTNLYCATADANVASFGWVEMWRRVQARALNPLNAPIQGAILYARDTNNGNRGAVSGVSGPFNGTTPTARDASYLSTDGLTLGADRTHIQTTAADGRTPQFNVLIGALAATVGIGRPGYDTGTSRIDRRGKTDVQGSRANTDAFDLHLWSYGHAYTLIPDFSMAGSGVAAPTGQMLIDAGVTLTQAQAAALTQIDTLDQFYDAAKDWKCQPQQARLEYPSISTQPVTASGTVLDLGNRNLVIDGTASVDFAINTGTNTITIRSSVLAAGTKFTSIRTTGLITFANGGSINVPYTDANGTRVTIRTADNLPLTTRILINGVDQGEAVQQTARNIFVGPTTQVRIFAIAYGYQPKIINITGNVPSDYVISLVPETNVDTSLDPTTRDAIVATFATGIDGLGRIFLSVNTDLRQYTPPQVLNALHRFMVVGGGLVAAAALAQNSVDGFALINGGFVIRSPGFYGKVADSVTTVGNTGFYIPLYVEVDPSVYVAMPTYTPVEANTSGILLGTATWQQNSFVLSPIQAEEIRDGIATQAQLQTLNTGVKLASIQVPYTQNI